MPRPRRESSGAANCRDVTTIEGGGRWFDWLGRGADARTEGHGAAGSPSGSRHADAGSSRQDLAIGGGGWLGGATLARRGGRTGSGDSRGRGSRETLSWDTSSITATPATSCPPVCRVGSIAGHYPFKRSIM
jgi:hypothetical protein